MEVWTSSYHFLEDTTHPIGIRATCLSLVFRSTELIQSEENRYTHR